ncbi:MAG: hypothetical protein ACTSUU_06845 [Candidatus Thorarchaeota archaeon]
MARSHTKEGSYTPQEAAYAMVITDISATVRDAGGHDWVNMDDRPSMKRKIKRQLIKLHNRLLEESGLDGINLEESDVH